MKSLLTLMLLSGVIVNGCRSSRPVVGPESQLANFKINEPKLSPGMPVWDKMEVQFNLQANPANSIKREIAQKSYKGGQFEESQFSVPGGAYLIALLYKDASGAILYESCAAEKTKIHDIKPPEYQTSINLCVHTSTGDGSQVGTTPITPGMADVSINPTLKPGSGTTGPTTPAPVEDFTSGINLAWIDFAQDIGLGTLNRDELSGQIAKVASSGGTLVRVWVHTNGAVTPAFSGSNVVGPGQKTVEDLKMILDIAQEENVGVIFTLWSFDMLKDEYRGKHNIDNLVKRNRLLLTQDAALQNYLDKALVPMVQGVKGHPALHSWEICNEPEGMTTSENWDAVLASDRVTMRDVQFFVNRLAGKIRETDPKARVTNGAVSFRYSSNKGEKNYYSDQELVKAGGDAKGYLDYYQVHYYTSKGESYNPFTHSAAHWGLDKPVMIGEFHLKEYLDYGTKYPHELYKVLKDKGYMGALGWKDAENPALTLMVNAMRFVKGSFALPSSQNLCSNFGGGYGDPFYSGEILYRKKNTNWDDKSESNFCRVE